MSLSATRILTPNAGATRQDALSISLAWAASVFVVWQFVPVPFLPKPMAVARAFEALRQQGTFLEFGTSIETMAESIIWTAAISLSLAYLSVVPVMRPLANFVAGLRYLGLVGLMLAFTLIAPTGHALKIIVLTFGMSVFMLKDLLSIVQAIPQERYDHAKTLGLGGLRTVWEVVVLGTLPAAMASLRVNAAMGWMMLTMVEGVVRSEGGIGTVLINMNRHMDLSSEVAILGALFAVGALQDAAIGAAADYLVCPYDRIGRGRS